MALRIPKTIDAVTGFLALAAGCSAILSLVSFLVFFTPPERNIDPAKLWIFPAITAIYTVATFWSYKQDKKKQLVKAKTTK